MATMQNLSGKRPINFLVPVHWLSTFLLAAALAFTLAKFFTPINSAWPEALLIVFATISSMTALARRLPLQNVFLAAFGIALIGSGMFVLSLRTAIPFGPFLFGDDAGTKLFKTLPWPIPLLWIVVILNSRGTARLILRPWRKIRAYGYWLIGLTAILTMLFDLALDPFAWFIRHYWIWLPTNFFVTWQGAPLLNFLGWGAVTVFILAFVTPALINKQMGKRKTPDFHPLAVWLGGILLFGIASALHGLWLIVITDAVIFSVTTVFAIRGGRW